MSSTPEAEHVEAITRAMSAWQGVRLETVAEVAFDHPRRRKWNMIDV